MTRHTASHDPRPASLLAGKLARPGHSPGSKALPGADVSRHEVTMNEIASFDFEGRPFEFRQVDGEWWATTDEASTALGYADKRRVSDLYNRHRDEFSDSEATVLVLQTVDGKSRKVRVFSPDGLRLLAVLARTPLGKRFRRWLLDIARRLYQGARLVTPDQLDAAIAKVRAEYDGQVRQLLGLVEGQSGTIKALSGAIDTQASSAAKLLSYISHSPETRAALIESRDERSGQGKLPFANRLAGGCNGSIAQTDPTL